MAKEVLIMQGLDRLPKINDNPTPKEIKSMAEELLSLKTDVDLRNTATNAPQYKKKRVAG